MRTSDELITKAETYLVQCGHCDAGLPMACVCPTGDPRAVISELVDALKRSGQMEAAQAGPCSATLPRLTEYGDLWCQLRHGHLGDHEMGLTRWKAVGQDATVTRPKPSGGEGR